MHCLSLCVRSSAVLPCVVRRRVCCQGGRGVLCMFLSVSSAQRWPLPARWWPSLGWGGAWGAPRLEVTERRLPLALLAVVVSVVAAVLFSTDYALGGAGLPVRTIAMVTLGVYRLRALLEGLITALVVRGCRAVCADLGQVARG